MGKKYPTSQVRDWQNEINVNSLFFLFNESTYFVEECYFLSCFTCQPLFQEVGSYFRGEI